LGAIKKKRKTSRRVKRKCGWNRDTIIMFRGKGAKIGRKRGGGKEANGLCCFPTNGEAKKVWQVRKRGPDAQKQFGRKKGDGAKTVKDSVKTASRGFRKPVTGEKSGDGKKKKKAETPHKKKKTVHGRSRP